MKRREFLKSSALSTIAIGTGRIGVEDIRAEPVDGTPAADSTPRATRKILIMGGGFGPVVLKYMAQLTGKPRPKILYLPTASADKPGSFLKNCEGLDVDASVQDSFISSYKQDKSWEEALLSVDAIVASGGNTLNQQAIWKAQGIDAILRKAWDQGIVLGGSSAGSLCWFEEGTTDSRPKELSTVKCLGFLKGSHSPHYDKEAPRRPLYMSLIASGKMKPGYACYNAAGIYFEDNTIKRVVATDPDAKVFHVTRQGNTAVETLLQPELIS